MLGFLNFFLFLNLNLLSNERRHLIPLNIQHQSKLIVDHLLCLAQGIFIRRMKFPSRRLNLLLFFILGFDHLHQLFPITGGKNLLPSIAALPVIGNPFCFLVGDFPDQLMNFLRAENLPHLSHKFGIVRRNINHGAGVINGLEQIIVAPCAVKHLFLLLTHPAHLIAVQQHGTRLNHEKPPLSEKTRRFPQQASVAKDKRHVV